MTDYTNYTKKELFLEDYKSYPLLDSLICKSSKMLKNFLFIILQLMIYGILCVYDGSIRKIRNLSFGK